MPGNEWEMIENWKRIVVVVWKANPQSFTSENTGCLEASSRNIFGGNFRGLGD
jgi:hypothetical protein